MLLFLSQLNFIMEFDNKKEKVMNFIKVAAYVLVLVGALNWGLVGAFDFNLVSYLFGDMSKLSRIVYLLVGLSAILSIVFSVTSKDDDGCGC